MTVTLRSPRFSNGPTAGRFAQAAKDSPTLKRNESHREAVRVLQQALIDAGFPLPESVKRYSSPDGLFGDETDSAVRKFQERHVQGSTPDGKVGQNTLKALDALLPGPGAPLPPLVDLNEADPDEVAKNTLLLVLVDPFIHRVRFSIRGQSFSFTQFSTVAELVRQERVSVRYDPVIRDTGLAVYNPDNNATVGPNTIAIPRIDSFRWKSRSVLVHESIHVIQDVRATGMTRIDSEMAAYVGQNIYHRLSARGRVKDSSPQAEAIHIAADAIAQRWVATTTGDPTVPASEITALETAIRNAGYPAENVPFDGVP